MLCKGLKSAASIPTNDLVPPIRQVRKHHSLAFQTPLLILTFTRAVSSPRLLETGIHLQILSFLLVKVQKTVAKFISLVRGSGWGGGGGGLEFSNQ